MTDWRTTHDNGLEAAIRRLKTELPGWWYSVCECQVSVEATIAPTVESTHISLIREAGDEFDAGFERSTRQPVTVSEVLNLVIDDALARIASLPLDNPHDHTA